MGDIPAELKKDVEKRFTIGPVVDRDFWNGKRASIAIDRGPCEFNLFPFKYDDCMLRLVFRGKPTALSDSDSSSGDCLDK